jgi:hypothetical protein
MLLALLAANADAASQPDPDLGYSLQYVLTPAPAEHRMHVRLRLTQKSSLLREMRFDHAGITGLRGDGTINVANERVVWQPPARGGELQWTIGVQHKRGSRYDAFLGTDWGLFRAEDVVPRAATRSSRGAYSITKLNFSLPNNWSVISEYENQQENMLVTGQGRRFLQPSGWILMGELGVRRELIAGTKVAVAGPKNESVRRMDMLALLNWTLPQLQRVLPHPLLRLTVVSAGKPMWRGGLSAPQSLYIHSDRPLISENGTSTLLHELLHVAMGASSVRGYDWIVEGFAEYYSLQLLVRSGTITEERYAAALEQQRRWSKSAGKLCTSSSSGPQTARAVIVLEKLDRELIKQSRSRYSLDDVLQKLLKDGAPISLANLREASVELIEQKPDALHIDRLNGCAKLAASWGDAAQVAWTNDTTSN